MSWRLTISAAESSSQAPLAKRRNTGGDADEDEGDAVGMKSMLLKLQKLTLHQQQTRSVSSAAWTTYKGVGRERAAGQSYAAAVSKKRTGHGRGNPHIHVAMATLEGAVVMGEAAQMPEERAVLQILVDELTARGPSAVHDLFPYFKVVDLSNGGAGRRRQEGEEVPKISLVQFKMSPFATLELAGVNLATVQLRLVAVRDAVGRILLKSGAEKSSGAGVPMALERLVQKDVDSLQRRR